MSPAAVSRPRPRPLADAPIEELLERTEDLARSWLVALLQETPLESAAALLTEPLTRDGPRVCDAVLRALVADLDLGRLAVGGALRPLAARTGELVGAHDPARASRAVDVLQSVLWVALRGELVGADGEDAAFVAALGERLAHVGGLVREAVLADASSSPAPPTELSTGHPFAREPPRPPEELEPEPAGAASSGPLWWDALADEVERSTSQATPLSLLLAELEDVDRVVVSASPERAGAALGEFADALRSALRGGDILVSDGEARAWVIARETARSGAHTLGARIAEAVGAAASVGGVPLSASVGIAVLGEDGESGDELIDAAEEARFVASARGVEVGRRVPAHER